MMALAPEEAPPPTGPAAGLQTMESGAPATGGRDLG